MKKWVFLSCVLAALLLAAGFLPLVAPELPENAPVVPAAVDRAGVYYRENAVATAAAADIVMEQSGYVLSAGNENVRLGMASTTKNHDRAAGYRAAGTGGCRHRSEGGGRHRGLVDLSD